MGDLNGILSGHNAEVYGCRRLITRRAPRRPYKGPRGASAGATMSRTKLTN